MDLRFEVDQELCIGCGECAQDCPLQLIEMKDDLPVLSRENEERCLRCQHCFAVCATGALRLMDLDPDESLIAEQELPSGEQMTALIKGRRSVRRYKQEPVASEDIAALLESVAYAPTAVNNRQVLFTVIEDIEAMQELRKSFYAILDERVKNGTLPEGMDFYLSLIAGARENGRDAIFRDAPHLLVASAPKESPAPMADSFIALSYFELLATSMGLGTLWCGLAKWGLTVIAPELLPRLQIPDSHEIGYMMLFGKPAVSYPRTVQRQNLHVNRLRRI